MTSAFEAYQLGEQQVNARGAKFCPLSAGGGRVQLKFGGKAKPLSTQWGPSTFDPSAGTSRANMDFICDEQMCVELKALDTWTRGYLEKQSQRLFGKALTKDQVKEGYRPSLIERGAYPPSVRCKINLSGARAVRCWNEHGVPREVPENWKNCKYMALATLSHLYIMSKEYGWVLNITDLQIFEEPQVCPF